MYNIRRCLFHNHRAVFSGKNWWGCLISWGHSLRSATNLGTNQVSVPIPLVLTLGTPFREYFLPKLGPMGGVRLPARPAKAKTTELLCKGPRGLKGHSFGGSGRAWEGPVGACGLGRGRKREGPIAPVLLLPLPPGDSRVSRKVSSGTWTRDSPTASRARLCGAVTTAAVVSGGRGRSTAGEAAG